MVTTPTTAEPTTAEPTAKRPRAVLICYACEPGAGSEEGVGWTWAEAAAAVADVVMFTNPVAAPIVQKAADALGLPITVMGPEPPRFLRAIATRRWGGFFYYLLWQGAAAKALRQLERDGSIDIVHHLTWASDSFPTALAGSTAPVRIWGPVGGSTRMVPGLYRFLSPRARVDEAVRDLANFVFRLVGGSRAARHATLVVALNHDVEAQFAATAASIEVEANCALNASDLMGDPVEPAAGGRSERVALFVGRMMGWKGPHLAVESLAHAPGWRLIVMGDGPERASVEARAASLGLSDRIEFRGFVPRSHVLAAFRTADALLFPSFHDSAPWAVGEAASLGCPVVCLDAGGPPLLAGRNAHIVPRHPTANLPQRVGAELSALEGRGEPEDRWSADRLPALLARWYRLDDVDSVPTVKENGAGGHR